MYFHVFPLHFGSYLVLSYLCSQFFHVGVNLVQDVKALLEQSVLGAHEGQHLQETHGDNDGRDTTVLLTGTLHVHAYTKHIQ